MSNNQAGIPGRGRQSKNQQSKTKIQEACAKKTNQPIRKSVSAGCCPEIYPWNVHESGRSYILNVTKEIDKKIINSDSTRKGAAEAISKGQKEKQHEFHIVAPKIDSNHALTFKELAVNHKFIKNKCNHIMMAQYIKNKKVLTEKELTAPNGVFKIDSNGHIKGAKSTECEKQAEFEREKQQASEAYIRCYKRNERVAKSFREAPGREKDLDYQKYVESKYESALQQCIDTFETRIEALDAKYDTTQELSDYEIIFKSIFNPKSISKNILIRPIGSKKCNSQPKVNLYIYPSVKYSGTLRLSYGWAYKQATNKEGNQQAIRIKQNKSKISLSGTLKGNYGTHILDLSSKIEAGGGSYKRKNRGSKKTIFGGVEKFLNKFIKMDKKNQTYLNSLSKDDPCDGKYPIFTFEPGYSGIMFGDTAYELKENKDKYSIDYAYNTTLKINLLSGATIKVDGLSLILSRVGGKAKDILDELRADACKGFKSSSGNISAKVEPVLEVSVSSGGAIIIAAKKDPGKNSIYNAKGSIKLGFIAKASIKVEGKVYFISVSAEMSGIMASDINPNVPSGYTFSIGYKNGEWYGDAKFAGLALYYVAKIDIKAKKDDSTTGGKEHGIGNISSAEIISASASGKYTIFDRDSDKKDNNPIDITNFLT